MQEEPIAAEAEESELVVAGEVVPEIEEGEEGVVTEPVVASETMEREAGAEAAADLVARARGLPPRLPPRPPPGEAVGSLEFIGLWKENTQQGQEDNRLMPIKMQGSANRDWETGDRFTTQLRVAFGRLVDDLVRNKVPSGILVISKWTETHYDDGVTFSTKFGISWSASPDDESYQRLGLISMQAPQRTNIRFPDFEGAIDVSGDLASEANAVYRVTLPRGGLDPWKWVSRPPPPAPADLYTGPRDDGLLSTGEISGEYGGSSIWGWESMTVVPLGADVIETWSSNLSWAPPFFAGPRMGGRAWTRKQHTNDFVQNAYPAYSITCSPDEISPHTAPRFPGASDPSFGFDCLRSTLKKDPHAQKPSFRKVETKDLAGKWCEGSGMFYLFGLCYTTKKALNEDQYEESGQRGCCMFLPVCSFCNEPEIRTRIYVNGHPTNGFDEWGRESYRDPSYTAWGDPASCRIGKKVG